jgi:N-acetylmuramoyl-L-alanine amidase
MAIDKTTPLLLNALSILLVVSLSLAQDNIDVISQDKGEIIGSLPCIDISADSYTAASKFSELIKIPFFQDDRLKQFTFKLVDESITVFGQSPFITTRKEIFQMPVQTRWRNNEFYIPVNHFLNCVADFFPFHIEYQATEKKLTVGHRSSDIQGIIIDKNDNNILLHILTVIKFPVENIVANLSPDGLTVDIPGCYVDTLQAINIQGTDPAVKKIIPHQVNMVTARLSFQIVPTVLEKNLLVTSDPPGILISLETDTTSNLISELQKEKEKWRIDTIIIDPGHGGKDPGAIGRNGTLEKTVTLEIAKKIKEVLEQKFDGKVLMTRSRDIFLPLKSRTDYANQNGGKLFISIHADSNPKRGLKGHTVYFMGPAKTDEARQAAQAENSVIRFEDSIGHYQNISDAAFILAANAQNSYNKESQAFASLIDQELKRTGDAEGFGVRQSGFYVLYGASMPNVLLETGFLSNRNEEKNLNNQDRQLVIARSVCSSILQFKSQFGDE